jgi:hypothetical protein
MIASEWGDQTCRSVLYRNSFDSKYYADHQIALLV